MLALGHHCHVFFLKMAIVSGPLLLAEDFHAVRPDFPSSAPGRQGVLVEMSSSRANSLGLLYGFFMHSLRFIDNTKCLLSVDICRQND